MILINFLFFLGDYEMMKKKRKRSLEDSKSKPSSSESGSESEKSVNSCCSNKTPNSSKSVKKAKLKK
jgi:hypothetical protein